MTGVRGTEGAGAVFPYKAEPTSVEPTFSTEMPKQGFNIKKPAPFNKEGGPIANAPEEVKKVAKTISNSLGKRVGQIS